MGALPTFVPLMKAQGVRHMDRAISKESLVTKPRPTWKYERSSPRVRIESREIVIVRDVINVMMPEPVVEVVHEAPMGEEILYPPLPPALAWRGIVREVCEKHRISYIDLCSSRRQKQVVVARHEAAWRLKNETTMSYPQIGRRLGGRDHTTIINSVQRYERMLAGEPYRDTHGKEYVSTANKENSE